MNKFYLSFYKLLSGGVLSQLIYFISLPVISRLYTLEDIGVYGMIISTINFFSILLTMRMELNIIADKNKPNAIKATVLFLFVSILLTSPIYLISIYFATGKNIVLAFLGLGAAIIFAFLQITNSTLLSKNELTKISLSNIIRVAFCVFVQITFFHVYGSSTELLLVGYLVSFLLPVLLFQKVILFPRRSELLKIKSYIITKFRETRYAGGQAFINALSQTIPYITFPMLFSESVLGLYFIADRAFRSPLMLLGNPIRQVFLKFCCDDNEPKKIYDLYRNIIYMILAPASIVIIILYVYGGELFSFVFGGQYYDSGLIALWLSVWGAGALISFPALSYLRVNLQNKFLFYNEILFCIVKLLIVLSSYFIFKNEVITIALFSIGGLISSLIITIKALTLIKKSISC